MTLVLAVRYLRQQDIEFHVGGREFVFATAPYALRLALGGEVAEDGSEEASYCVESGSLTVRLPKQIAGSVFGDPVVVEIECLEDMEMEEEDKEERTPVYYGFNSHYTGVFLGLTEYDVTELPEPEKSGAEERRLLRAVAEESKFDGDYYLGDLMNGDDYDHVFTFSPFWNAHVAPKISEMDAPPVPAVAFSEQDYMLLARIQPKSFLLESDARVACGLVDLLFAYAHHEVTMAGEESCEASWTISRLSRLLSWLDSSEERLDASLVTNYRRALCYPLYRSWKLCVAVQGHVAAILRAGKAVALKCLLNIHHAMTHNSEKRYLLNTVFISDYIAWIQLVDDALLARLSEAVERIMIRKESVEFNLVELETLARDDAAQPETDFMELGE